MITKYIKVFLRAFIAIGFLSAVADRFGFWGPEISAWGNWSSFVSYTQAINPWFPDDSITLVAILATALELVFALGLLIGIKTNLFARLSGLLLLLFGLAMMLSPVIETGTDLSGLKGVLDYSVLTAAAAAFGLSTIQGNFLELDALLEKS